MKLKVIILTAALLCLGLAGCAMQTAPPTPPPASPIPTPTAPPTVSVSFQAVVTPVVTRVSRRPTPTPTATRFVPPSWPYLRLVPSSGPPASRLITVYGGNLPKNDEIELDWSPNGKESALSTTTYTDRRGAFQTQFNIPASPPGKYHIIAIANGLEYADATYAVRSQAQLTVTVTQTAAGTAVTAVGRHFVPDTGLILIAYPMQRGLRQVVIGRTSSNRRGSFTFRETVRRMPPGEYLLRALSTTGLSAQMAETLMEVVV